MYNERCGRCCLFLCENAGEAMLTPVKVRARSKHLQGALPARGNYPKNWPLSKGGRNAITEISYKRNVLAQPQRQHVRLRKEVGRKPADEETLNIAFSNRLAVDGYRLHKMRA